MSPRYSRSSRSLNVGSFQGGKFSSSYEYRGFYEVQENLNVLLEKYNASLREGNSKEKHLSLDLVLTDESRIFKEKFDSMKLKKTQRHELKAGASFDELMAYLVKYSSKVMEEKQIPLVLPTNDNISFALSLSKRHSNYLEDDSHMNTKQELQPAKHVRRESEKFDHQESSRKKVNHYEDIFSGEVPLKLTKKYVAPKKDFDSDSDPESQRGQPRIITDKGVLRKLVIPNKVAK